MRVEVAGCAICAPGLPDWPTAVEVLTGHALYDASKTRDPQAIALPANERRRLPITARWALCVGNEALAAASADTKTIATVFTSCGSDGEITHQICESLARDPPDVSPTRFHNSVHNAPSGYWSIGLASHAPSTSLCAFEGSFAAGLVEAAAQVVTEQRPVLLIAYDVPYPAPLASMWHVTRSFCAALVLTPVSDADSPRLAIDIVDEALKSDWPEAIPAELRVNPAAAALALLAPISRRESGRVVLPYHATNAVVVSVSWS
ncbi:MAG TPA: beta-ketoacyl synthase chain length factor [Casimicrobiaceae bacterium]|nr:beta-ketoacyl synthase chain length factor [Casimicrobiaceae bacterium]